MYLERLHIRHLRLLRDLELRFTNPDGSPRMFTVLIGKNGTGKTSILQAIAIAVAGVGRVKNFADFASLCDVRSEAGTAIEACQRDVRTNKSLLNTIPFGRTVIGAADITIHGGTHNPFMSEPPSVEAQKSIDSLIQKINETGAQTPHSNTFIVAYGINRTTPPELYQTPLQDPPSERIESLFSARKQLLGINFIDLIRRTRREHSADYERHLTEVFARASQLLPEMARFEPQGSEPPEMRLPDRLAVAHRFVMAPHGGQEVRLPAGWLSQGYQGLIAWIADMMGYACLHYGRAQAPGEIEGIALVDEIDLYLHPSWQVQLVPILRHIFPKVQFIVTTHSPLVLSSLKSHEVVTLDFDDAGDIVARPHDVDPRLKTGSELLQSFFHVQNTYPAELGRTLRRYLYLANDPYRSDDEEQELDRLEATLRDQSFDPGFPRVPREALPPAPPPEEEAP